MQFRLHTGVCRPVTAVILTSAVVWGGAAWGQSITPVAQNRDINAFVIVPPCGSDADSRMASNFGTFDEEVFVDLQCDDSYGAAFAEQVSSIGPTSILARGATASQVEAIEHNVIHAISSSTCDVTFDLAVERAFDLTGHLSASGRLPVVLGAASVRLTRGDGTLIFELRVEPGDNGEFLSQNVCADGVLTAGRYRLQIHASTVIDSTVPPNGAGESAYDIAFTVGRRALWNTLQIQFGGRIEGGLADMADSDDDYLIVNSVPGFLASEPNIVAVNIGGRVPVDAEQLHVSVETAINQPAGMGRVMLMNWGTGTFESIGTYGLGISDRCITFPNVDGHDFIRDGNGRVIVGLRGSVLATFSATGFRWFGDRLNTLAD